MATATKSAITFQASASNAAAATTTGTGQDYTTAVDGGRIYAKITNGGTGPTVACDFVVQESSDNSTYREVSRQTAGKTNSGVYEFVYDIPRGTMYVRTVFVGNTGQTVTVEAYGTKYASIA